jgi:hypothetical protein
MASTSKNSARQVPRRRTKPIGPGRTRPAGPAASTKLDLMVKMLRRPKGASLAALTKATGWQPHSVRGALAGSLKRKGHSIRSEKTSGERRYRIDPA